ncbi:MAG: hypothetical protein EXS13_13765 [Planctomycetes bacterium]|nr:hypothetical protein [Planctomycetota bacterium]
MAALGSCGGWWVIALAGVTGESGTAGVERAAPRALSLRRVAPEHALRGGAGAWPRPAGILVPDGMVDLGERFALFEGAVERSARFSTWLARSDGTPAWVAITVGVVPDAVGALELRPTRTKAPAAPLRCRSDGGREWLDGGDEGASFAAGRDLLVAVGAAVLKLDWHDMTVVELGDPLKSADWRTPLRVGPDGGGVEWSWRARFGDAGRDAAWVAIRCDVASDGAIAAVEWTLTAARDFVLERWRVGGSVECGGGGGVELRVGGSKVAADRTGRAEAKALRGESADGGAVGGADRGSLSLRAGSGRRRVELWWDDFGRARPAACALTKSGRITLDLVAESLSLHAGQVVRRRLELRCGRWVGASNARPWLVARTRNPAGATLPTEAIDAWCALFAAQLAAPQRLDDRGCYSLEDGDFANGEYDLGGSLLALGMAEGEASWIAVGEALARHTLDWDQTHERDGSAPAGLFAQHGRDHSSGKVEAGHQWIGGALGLARATGDLAAFEAARTTVAALAGWRSRQPDRFAGPERRLAWPLRAAVELWQATAAEPAQAFARELCDALAGRQQGDGFIDGDRRPFTGGPRLWVNSWVSLGITVDAMARAGASLQAPEMTVAAARLAEAVVRAGRLEGDGLAEVVWVDPETGLTERRPARIGGGDAALAAAGIEWLIDARGAEARPEWGALATALQARAWSGLAVPRADRAVDFAKALQALLSERERQSLSVPSSLR